MIVVQLPGIPPSSNTAYFNVRGGGRVLSSKGRKYKNETLSYLATHYPIELKQLVPDAPFLLYVVFELEALENKSGQTRYKKIDVSNRLKLFEDCLKDAGGIDDSQFMCVMIEKRQARVMETTTAALWNLEKERVDFGELSLGPL